MTSRARLFDTAQPRTGRISQGYARWVVALRWWVIGAWMALAVAASTLLSGISPGGSGGLDGFVPVDSPAVQTEVRSYEAFGFPLSSRTVLVQRDPDGLSAFTQTESVLRAVALTRGQYDDAGPLLGALPLSNTLGAFPGARERDTTVLTYLFTAPSVGFSTKLAAGRDFARDRLEPEDKFVGVTGSIPARVEQARLVGDALPLVEAATLTAIFLIVAANFRSLVAPLVTLVTAGTALFLTVHLAGFIGSVLGVAVPSELEPLLVALQLGVVTDYVIFFLSALKRRFRAGDSRLSAARHATAEFAPIVAVAGITVAAGTGALLAARSDLFRAFGPGMVIAILTGLAVALTLVPALMAVLGRWLFWPSRPDAAAADHSESPDLDATPGKGARRRRGDQEPEMAGPGPSVLAGRTFQGRTVEIMTRRRNAALLAAGCTVGLALAALPMMHMGLGLSFVPSLPNDNAVAATAAQAQAGFADGILSPTTVLVEGTGVTGQRPALARLGADIEEIDGVAGVLGPGEQFLPTELGIFLSRDGAAARYLVVLEDDPLGAAAIATMTRLKERMPAMLEQAGIPDATADMAGDTAIAQGVVSSTQADIVRIAIASLAVNLLLLAIFLRALVAPLYLLASSVLALGATLGLTTLLFQDILGHEEITFYVPFAAAVLLVALGSDYNIFGVGHVWASARHQPLRAALIQALPQSTRAITAAGITLAVSFGLLALVPLRPFYELAFAMFVGILLDAIVVRSFLVPALIALVGRRSGWPGGQLQGEEGDSGNGKSGDRYKVVEAGT